MKFKLDDPVVVNKTTEEATYYPPKTMIGKVLRRGGHYSNPVYTVIWSNGKKDSYYNYEIKYHEDTDKIAPIKIPKKKTNNLTF